MKTLEQYTQKAAQLASKYPNLVEGVEKSPWGGKLFIEVSTVDKAKALNQMFPDYSFSCGSYK